MSTNYRLISPDGSSAGEADSLQRLVEIAKAAPQGRYQIEKLSLDPATGELRSSGRGTIIKDGNGSVKLAPPPGSTDNRDPRAGH